MSPLTLTLHQCPTPVSSTFQVHQRPSLSKLNTLSIAPTTHSSATRPIVFSCRGLTHDGRLDVVAALRTGLLELVEGGKGGRKARVVEFPKGEGESEVEAGARNVVPKTKWKSGEKNSGGATAGLVIDTTAAVWRTVLEVGGKYMLRFAAGAGARQVWCRYSDEEEKLQVVLERDSNVRFTVHAEPTAPVFEAMFGVEPEVAHLSGDPLFKFVVELTYTPHPDNDEEVNKLPVTFCTQHRPYGAMLPFGGGLNSPDQLVHCTDAETGKEPHWYGCYQCWDDGDPWGRFPGDEDFVEVAPGGTWRFEYTLDPRNNTTCGGLDDLEKGRRYRVGLAYLARYGFPRWMFGMKEDLLRGTVEERIERWEWESRRWLYGPWVRDPIRVEEMNEPVFFDVVD